MADEVNTGDRLVNGINQVSDVIGTLVPTVGAIGTLVRLIASAVRPTDVQKAQPFDEAIAAYDAAKGGLDTAISGFEQAKTAAEFRATGGARRSFTAGRPVLTNASATRPAEPSVTAPEVATAAVTPEQPATPPAPPAGGISTQTS